jgi:propionyl-CoA carboxylase alpha chain
MLFIPGMDFFLSENADFAEKARNKTTSFLLPKSKAIHIMGSKLAAKEAAKAYNIPMVPGFRRSHYRY